MFLIKVLGVLNGTLTNVVFSHFSIPLSHITYSEAKNANIPLILFCFWQGLNFCLPILDTIKHVQSLKEIAIAIPEQSAITVG